MYMNMHTGGEMGMVVGSPKSKARARVHPTCYIYIWACEGPLSRERWEELRSNHVE